MSRPAHSPGREYVQPHAEYVDADDGDPEIRRGNAKYGDGAGHLVDPCPTFDGGDNPQWDGHTDSNEHREWQQLQRIGKALEEKLGRRLLVNEGVAESRRARCR